VPLEVHPTAHTQLQPLAKKRKKKKKKKRKEKKRKEKKRKEKKRKEKKRKEKKRKEKKRKEKKGKEKNREEYAFLRQFNEKPNIIPGRPGPLAQPVLAQSKACAIMLTVHVHLHM